MTYVAANEDAFRTIADRASALAESSNLAIVCNLWPWPPENAETAEDNTS